MPDEWRDLPLLLTVEEAGRLLRVGRSHAYNQVTLYFASGGTDGIPALRLGGLLRVPKHALHELVTTGCVVQLIADATAHATAPSVRTRARRTSDRAQLSLLSSD
jgi:Helix-turn-helix domain